MNQTSVQFQLYSKNPTREYYLPIFPIEFFPSYEQAKKIISVYQDWDQKHSQVQLQYRVMKVTTVIEEVGDGN